MHKNREQALNEFESFADKLNYYPPNVQIVDSLSGDIVPVHRILGGSYWRQQLTDSPSLQDLKSFTELNCDLILKIGPDEKLDGQDDAFQLTTAALILNSVAAAGNATDTLLQSLGQLYVSGCNPDFKAFGKHGKHKRISLPHYPFEKKRYWITELGEHDR